MSHCMCAIMMTHDDGDTQVMRRHHTQVTVVTKKQPLVTTAFLHTKSNSCSTPPPPLHTRPTATAMSCRSHGHASRRLHPPHQHDAHPRPRVCAHKHLDSAGAAQQPALCAAAAPRKTVRMLQLVCAQERTTPREISTTVSSKRRSKCNRQL
jgi:hypothetical protein